MLRYSTIFNPGVSINQGKRLPEMAKIGGGAPRTRLKGNLMECTRTIYPTSIINGPNKTRVIENPKKRAGPSVQGIVKTKLGVV